MSRSRLPRCYWCGAEFNWRPVLYGSRRDPDARTFCSDGCVDGYRREPGEAIGARFEANPTQGEGGDR